MPFRLVLDLSTFNGYALLYLIISIWTSYILAEQLCITFLLAVKSRINAAIAVTYIICICLTLASGTVRSNKGLTPWLQENVKGIHTKYAATLLYR